MVVDTQKTKHRRMTDLPTANDYNQLRRCCCEIEQSASRAANEKLNHWTAERLHQQPCDCACHSRSDKGRQ